MAGFIKVEVEKAPTQALNTKINKNIFYDFKVKCKKMGLPLNVAIETFMQQYANGKFKLSEEDIMKYKNDGAEVETLNTTFNKEIYTNFKSICKIRGYFVKHVITAFMEKFADRNLILEYVDTTKTNDKE